MFKQFRDGSIWQGSETKKRRIVSKPRCKSRFGDSLVQISAYAGNLHARGGAHFLHRQRQNGFEQSSCRIANGELRGVYSDSDSSSAGGEIVSRQGALAPFIQLAFAV